jgi:hypothetical protein
MGTITPALGSTAAAGTADVDARRQTVNAFIRSSDLFDGVIDFDAATRDPRTGGLRPEFQPNSSIGGPGDGLHPNRAGYLAMGTAVDLKLLTAPLRKQRITREQEFRRLFSQAKELLNSLPSCLPTGIRISHFASQSCRLVDSGWSEPRTADRGKLYSPPCVPGLA